MRRYILFVLFLCLHWVAWGETQYTYRYWFDNDGQTMRTGTSDGSALHLDADLTGLDVAFHTIHLQVKDSKDVWSSPVTRSFFKLPVQSERGTYRYWMDGDHEHAVSGQYTGGEMMVDVSAVDDGFHLLYMQVDCGNAPSAPQTKMFIKVPQLDGNLTCLCSIDGKVYKQEKVTSAGGALNWVLDVDALEQGLHRMQVQVVTPSGAATSVSDHFFLRAATRTEIAGMKLLYNVDGQSFKSVKGSGADGLFHFDLNVAELEDGLHRLTYLLSSETGTSTKVSTSFFVKTPVGGYGIMSYKYWLNNDETTAKSVTLAKRANPFSLVSLLPMPTCPIRSSCFCFEIVDGKPVIYAKNDVHFRFVDASNRVAETTKQYVDYNVSQAVSDVAALQPSQTFARPAANEIKWFRFEAEQGDTVTFKTSQACSIQLFSPLAEEVYSASGSTSVVFGGCHTWESGTYYLAVHDVTGSKADLTLEYSHLAKYEVVSQDVGTVGNGGCSTITFKGNGFNSLHDIDIVVNTERGPVTLSPADINHISDVEVEATFDFSVISLPYTSTDDPQSSTESVKADMIFHFTDNDKYRYDCLTVEKEKPIELTTSVTFPSSFGHSVTYTCKITNHGNMTAYGVPIYTWIKSKLEKGIYDIQVEGLDIPKLSESVSTEVLTEQEAAALRQALDALDDDHLFMKYWVEDEDKLGDSVCVRSNYFYTNIAPNTTKTIRLTISTSEVDAFAYFTVPEEWPSYTIESMSEENVAAKARFSNARAAEWYCCYRDKVECLANVVCYGLDIASLFSVPGPTAVNIASCVAGALNQVITAAGDTFCGKNDVEGNFIKKVNNIVKGINIAATLTSCASAMGVKNAGEIVLALDALTHPSVTMGCITSLFQKKPNCPPMPPEGGGAVGGKSHDPNDIYGYIHESGSLFISDSVRNVSYRIEFENDTAFATASAHVVEVRDTFDCKYFDLATFSPTSIKIGKRTEYLDGTPEFIKTIDLRPEINAIAQVEGRYEQQKGIATWLFTSLDPMTMEPTDNIMDGLLPVNYDGESGMGEVSFDISLNQGLSDGTCVIDKASIVFDNNDPIMTPTWTNIVDAVCPESKITNISEQNDTIAAIFIEGDDTRSGIWKYDLYVQYGKTAPWVKAAVCSADSNYINFRYYNGIDYGFCVIATDSAGNTEKKQLAREAVLAKVDSGDVNSDGEVNTLDATLTTAYYLEQPVYILALAADINNDGKIDTLDATLITQMFLDANVVVNARALMTKHRIKTNVEK